MSKHKLRTILYACICLMLIALTGCDKLTALIDSQLQTQAPTQRFDLETILRNIHTGSANITSIKTKFKYKNLTESRFFTINDENVGEYSYQYDNNSSLIAASGTTVSNSGEEKIIWLSTRSFLQHDGSDWEASMENPNQSFSILTAYNVFTKLENKFKLITDLSKLGEADASSELIEFYYEDDSKFDLEILSQIGNINLQQLPLSGLKTFVHYYIVPTTGLIQQVNLDIVEEKENKLLTSVEIIFYDANIPLRLEAPITESNEQETPHGSYLSESERWEYLSAIQNNVQNLSTYNALTDLKYHYNTQQISLKGHIVNSGQVVKNGRNYFFRGDRRLQNDRVDKLQEFIISSFGNYIRENDAWLEQKTAINKKDLLNTLIYDFLQLNQGIIASDSNGKTTFTYSGKNQLFFMLCQDLFNMDMTQFKGFDIQIDLTLNADNETKVIDDFKLHLRSPYNNTLDMNGKIRFLNFDGQTVVEMPEELKGR